jgi:beta-lactamase regulating signal transducer with metallopeptidase domain
MNILIETLNLWGSRFTAFAQPMFVQSAFLIALLYVADLLIRKKARASVRYALWMLVLVKLVLPPSLALPTGVAYWLPNNSPSQLMVTEPRATSAVLPTTADTRAEAAARQNQSFAQTPAPRPALTWPAILFTGWIAVFAGLAARVAWRFRYVARLLEQTTPAPELFQNLTESCRRQLGIRRIIPLRFAATAISPAICGLFRPVIIIPAALPQKLSESELRSVLLHELAHFKRGDLWISHAQILLQIVYWYNPLLWLANATLRRLREQAVDERVLVELREEAESYPATLVQVAKLALRRPALSIGLVGILEPGSSLNQRIRHMIDHPVPQTARLGIRGLVLIALIALLALPMGKTIVLAAADTAEKADAAKDVPSVRAELANLFSGQAANAEAPQGQGGFSGGLTAEQVQEFEARLKGNPEDAWVRNQLLGYYSLAQSQSQEARQARQQHILWLIEHHPEAAVLGSPHGSLNRVLDGSVYEQAKTLWLKTVQANPKQVAILGNAASFCLLQDRTIAEDFLKQAQALEPLNPAWSAKLAHLYQLDANYPKGSAGNEAAKKALEQMEQSQAGTTDANSRFYNLDYLAKMAFSAGNMAKARAYATEFLQQAEQNKSSWAYGNAINHGNVILGRIALREGRLDAAKKHLLAAGATKGSPQLNSFGPNMALAKELLEKGERETALEYFKLCGTFWKLGADKLDRWAKEVNAGLAPDFGGALNY